MTTSTATRSTVREVALRGMAIMKDGSVEDFERLIHPEFLNHEAHEEPPGARRPGPAGAYATALWLREAFAGLDWQVHATVTEGDLCVVHCTMSGRHVAPFAQFGPDGDVLQAMPPTGRPFAVTQTHWLRVRDGRVVEHWANRDDIGMALQLGWIPPDADLIARTATATAAARERYAR